MPGVETFPPLTEQTALMIRARMDADVNAGIDPYSDEWVDTTEGGVYWDLTQGDVLEIERLYDFGAVEVVAAVFPAFAWGVYLDLHGDTKNIPRKDEVAATGAVLFTGVSGTLISTGTQVGTVQLDPDTDPLSFSTLVGATLAESPGVSGLAAVISGASGTLPAGKYYYVVTAILPTGETIISNEVSATSAGGTQKAVLTWSARATATGYKVYRSTTRGQETLLATLGVVLTYDDTGAATPGPQRPATNLVEVEANTPGQSGNVDAGTITQLLTPIAGVASVINPESLSGGAEVESDALYRQRLLEDDAAPQGAGNVADYVRWAKQYPPIGYVSVQPLWAGAGTVRVIVTDQQNNPVSATVTSGLQAVLDPVAGLGHGLAPIGAIVTVATPTTVAVAVAATLTLASGYSLDDASMIPVRSDVNASLADYINSLIPGDDVILNHVKARFFAVPGVIDISGVLLNGVAANVTIAALEVAQMGTVSLA